MGTSWSRWLRGGASGAGAKRAPTDPRLGTNVAIGMPVLAVVAVFLSARAGEGGFGALGLGATLALAVAAAVLGCHPIALGPRTLYALETPVVLLAGLLGGPLAGAAVGAASGIGDVNGVWRRRATYAGIASLQGLVAGHAGAAWSQGRLSLGAAGALGALGVLSAGAVGIAIVQIDRGSFSPPRIAWSAGTDVAGLVLALAPVLLMADAFAARPGLVLAAATSVAAAAVIVARFGEEREEAAAERHQVLLRDWLTGAASRAFFEVELERAREHVLRGGHPAGLLVVDADRFKEVNDRYGHTVGDGVLRELVRRIEGCARGGDVVARWGGEEFCVLAPGLGGVEELTTVAERIRSAVASRPFDVGGLSIPMTVSIGGTLLDGSLRSEAAFEVADRALYRAKRDRDTTCVLSAPAAATGCAASAAQRTSANAA